MRRIFLSRFRKRHWRSSAAATSTRDRQFCWSGLGRILVVGSSASGLNPLGQIDDPVEVDLLAGLCRRVSSRGLEHVVFQAAERGNEDAARFELRSDGPAVERHALGSFGRRLPSAMQPLGP